MSSNDDYYKFLDVPPTASHEEIRSAFRQMALKYHPDRNKDPWAETIFKQINEAYQVLGNREKRAAYDAARRADAIRAEESQRAARQRQYYEQGSSRSGSGYEGRGPRSSGVIICPICGLTNHQGSKFCSNCGRELEQDAYARHGGPEPNSFHEAGSATPLIPNYLVKAILATLICFWPAGLVSIVFAARVNGKIKDGDIKGALRCSRNAKIWAWVAFGLGIPFFSFSVLGIIIALAE